jgi:transposase
MFLQTRRQVFEVPSPKIDVIEYQVFGCSCPRCGTVNRGITPEDVNSPVQYGKMAKSLAVLFNNEFNIPVSKIRQLFNTLYGCNMNESTVISILESCYNRLSQTEEIIKNKIKQEAVGHVDETGIRIEKKLNWLHVFSTQLYTYLFAHSKRGQNALESQQSIIPDFKNRLIHDCWSSYFTFTQVQHALCNAHILRELQSEIDNNEKGEDCWAKKMQDFLLQLHQADISECLKNKLSINTKYYQICRQGLAEEPPPIKGKNKRGRVKNSKARNLLRRLIKYKSNIIAFAYNENIPFTNNQAERDLRPAKIKLKISNTFRSNKGADYYARIQGFISTARKNGKNILEELYNTFNGYNFIALTE